MKNKAIALLLIVAAQVSCASRAEQLRSARERWNAAGINSYRMKMKVSKTGHAGPMGALMIEVRDGNLASREPIPKEWLGGDIEKCAAYDTVPEMFDFIEQADKRNPDRMSVWYDSTLGYPTRVSVDADTRAIDDELSFEVVSFEKIQ